MATYPSLVQCEGTVRVIRSGTRLRVATNGTVRPRQLASGPRYDPVLVHTAITLAQLQTLIAFYEARISSVAPDPNFTLVYLPNSENVTMTCAFDEKGLDYKGTPGGTFDVTVYLKQVT